MRIVEHQLSSFEAHAVFPEIPAILGLVLIPRPQDFVSRMAGLHKEVWADVDADSYLEEERDSWQR